MLFSCALLTVLLASANELLTDDYNSVDELFTLSKFHTRIKETGDKEAAQMVVHSKCASAIKVIYKAGEIATLAIPRKLILNKLEPTCLPVYILEKEKNKQNVSNLILIYILPTNITT